MRRSRACRGTSVLALLALWAALAARPASTSAAGPLAAALGGRVYPLDAGAAALELPLACPGRPTTLLALQQPIPPSAAGPCTSSLELHEQGAGAALAARWLGQQVRGTTRLLGRRPTLGHCVRLICSRSWAAPARLQQPLRPAVPPSPLVPVAAAKRCRPAYWTAAATGQPRQLDPPAHWFVACHGWVAWILTPCPARVVRCRRMRTSCPWQASPAPLRRLGGRLRCSSRRPCSRQAAPTRSTWR